MAKFIVNNAFQFGGVIRREGSELTIGDLELKKEIAGGKHPDTNKPLSGLLNHCSPADDATAEMCKGLCEEKPEDKPLTEEEIAAKIEEIKKEMDAIGKAYHPGWKLVRFQKELIKAKKETGA